MARITEIRVHGVSGTPPRYMLRTDPVPTGRRPPASQPLAGKPDRTQPVELYERSEAMDDHAIVAYSWSKLTSGRPRHALWLLVLPYTFLNVAGWMLPPRQRGSEPPGDGEMGTTWARWMDVTVRLAGGVLTGIFALFASAIMIDLVAAKCRPGTDTCSIVRTFPELTPAWWLFIATAVALIVTVGMGLYVGLERGRGGQAKRARQALAAAGGEIPEPTPGEGDPAATLTITDPTLWHPRKISRHLVYTHLGISALALAWVLSAIRGHTTGTPISGWVVALATVVVFGVLVLASSQQYSKRMRYLSVLAAFAGLVAYVVALIDASGLSDVGWGGIAVEAGLAWTSVWLTGIITFAGVVIWLVGAGKKYSTSGPAAMVVLGGLLGAAFGAGAYTLIQRALISGREPSPVSPLGGMEWAAFGFLVYVLIVVAFILWTVAFDRLLLPEPMTSEGLRLVTTKVRGHLGWPAAAAFGGAGFFIVWSILDEGSDLPSPFDALDWLARLAIVGLAVGVLVLVVAVVYRYYSWKVAVLLAGGITVLYALVGFGKITEVKVLGAVVRFDTLRELTLSLALLVPVGFITSRLISTFRNREARRGIAILWDLGSFWPRWYHPFAAPSYTQVAVPDLAALVREKAADDGRVIVAAHSQGSIISMSALLTIPEGDPVWERLAYLTYGNPLCQLYTKLFSGHFDAPSISSLSARLGGGPGGCDPVPEPVTGERPRWRNLWRQSDPIGTDVGVPGVSGPAMTERIEDGHSGYEATEAFRTARRELEEMITG